MRNAFVSPVVALALVATAAPVARAEDWPSRPVTVISAFPPGNNDAILRLVDGPFQGAHRQPLVVEHRPGAGGNIGAEAVVRSQPDGHTLLVSGDTVATVNPRLYPNLRFRADADLVPVVRARDAQGDIDVDPG